MIADRIVSIIRDMDLPGLKRDDIRIQTHPDLSRPEFGIIVAPLPEKEEQGLNEKDDIVYSYQVLNIFHDLTSELEDKADYRDAIRARFNHKRIGYSDSEACELVTRVSHAEIEPKSDWDRKNIDNNILIISVQVRVKRS
jgi:hypothetical protein